MIVVFETSTGVSHVRRGKNNIFISRVNGYIYVDFGFYTTITLLRPLNMAEYGLHKSHEALWPIDHVTLSMCFKDKLINNNSSVSLSNKAAQKTCKSTQWINCTYHNAFVESYNIQHLICKLFDSLLDVLLYLLL